MSDTPRTDAIPRRGAFYHYVVDDVLDLARQLERELEETQLKLVNRDSWARDVQQKAEQVAIRLETSQQQLLASQLREGKLREALKDIEANLVKWFDLPHPQPSWIDRAIDRAKKELSTPTDDSLLKEVRNIVEYAVCPNCDGSGAKLVGQARRATREMALDAGDQSLEGCVVSEPEVEQCQWCDERKHALQLFGRWKGEP